MKFFFFFLFCFVFTLHCHFQSLNVWFDLFFFCFIHLVHYLCIHMSDIYFRHIHFFSILIHDWSKKCSSKWLDTMFLAWKFWVSQCNNNNENINISSFDPSFVHHWWLIKFGCEFCLHFHILNSSSFVICCCYCRHILWSK